MKNKKCLSVFSIWLIVLNVKILLGTFLILILTFQSCTETPPSEEELRANVQNRLDSGELPLDIWNSLEPEEIVLFQGLRYGGGIIISFNTSDGSGLVASPQDLDSSPWGCHYMHVPNLPSNTVVFPSTSVGGRYGDGLTNTLSIIASDCGSSSAAQVAVDYVNEGYDDWFLPSLSELGSLGSLELTEARGEYWSSTAYGSANQQDSTLAFASFINVESECVQSNGGFDLNSTRCYFSKERNQVKKVRAVRYF
jgi:hypothetical protein